MKYFGGIVLIVILITSFSCKKKKNVSIDTDIDSHKNYTTIHVEGKKILTANGIPIQFRGVCFGNEVWTDNVFPSTHHTEEDFERVSAMGMNVIRFYMNYKTFEDDNNPYIYKAAGWNWLEQNIEWAKNNNIYLILNMHVPQGGFQSNGNGGNLWTVNENQKRLKALWNKIAKRYANEPTIAGFDLVNEPVVTTSLSQWENLAQQLVDTIRQVDKNHMIIIERLNAVGNNWNSNENMNFFRVKDNNVAYTFHFYSPIEYTHQNTSWTNLGDGGKYPDEGIISTTGIPKWYTGTFSNPKLSAGTNDWTYLQGIKYHVVDPAIKLGLVALIGEKTGSGGKVYFDDLIIKEYDENQLFVRDVMSINPTSIIDWSYWSANNDGIGNFENSIGHGDNTSLSISASTGDASFGNYSKLFIPKQGYYYEISGWVKGENLDALSRCRLRIDFQTSSYPVYVRNKEYLSSILSQFTAWGDKENVPLYCGEFGIYKDCYDNNKGGLIWVSDMLDLLKQHKIHFTFHAYHEDSFGIYPGYGILPNPNNGRMELINLFKEKLK